MTRSLVIQRRLFSSARCLQHENPLGLPRAGSIPQFPRRQKGLPEKRKIANVDKVIAVSSAKGGVGKSTISVNIALAYARNGLRAGILDTDIFGPSIPTLLNLDGEPRLTPEGFLIPLTNYGLHSMSMGYLMPPSSPSTPVAWRGLMVQKAIQQLLHSVAWPSLDVLIMDLPPGTGDIQLTIGQQVVVDGAVIVSTPQDIALKDAVKGIGMFRKMDIPIAGMVRNMSFFACPHCGGETRIFGHAGHETGGGVEAECKNYGIEFLGDVPLDARVCEDADRGKPTVVAEEGDEKSPRRNAYLNIAKQVADRVGMKWPN